MMVVTCFVFLQLPAAPPDVNYPLDGGKILHINGRIRESTCEVLFEQDNEEKSVATLILDAIVKVGAISNPVVGQKKVFC